jgi:uncharacterized membrane protein
MTLRDLKLVGLGILIMPLLDFCWIGFIMNETYMSALRPLLRVHSDGSLDPILWAAFLVYVCLAAGLRIFVLNASPRSLAPTLIKAFTFGVLVYGVYDFTNLSLLKDWTTQVALIDVFWGGMICSLTTLVLHKLD